MVENKFPKNQRLLELLEDYSIHLYGKHKDNKGDTATNTTQTAQPDPKAYTNIRPTPSAAENQADDVPSKKSTPVYNGGIIEEEHDNIHYPEETRAIISINVESPKPKTD